MNKLEALLNFHASPRLDAVTYQPLNLNKCWGMREGEYWQLMSYLHVSGLLYTEVGLDRPPLNRLQANSLKQSRSSLKDGSKLFITFDIDKSQSFYTCLWTHISLIFHQNSKSKHLIKKSNFGNTLSRVLCWVEWTVRQAGSSWRESKSTLQIQLQIWGALVISLSLGPHLSPQYRLNIYNICLASVFFAPLN